VQLRAQLEDTKEFNEQNLPRQSIPRYLQLSSPGSGQAKMQVLLYIRSLNTGKTVLFLWVAVIKIGAAGLIHTMVISLGEAAFVTQLMTTRHD